MMLQREEEEDNEYERDHTEILQISITCCRVSFGRPHSMMFTVATAKAYGISLNILAAEPTPNEFM
jgi:hypothetical protein